MSGCRLGLGGTAQMAARCLPSGRRQPGAARLATASWQLTPRQPSAGCSRPSSLQGMPAQPLRVFSLPTRATHPPICLPKPTTQPLAGVQGVPAAGGGQRAGPGGTVSCILPCELAAKGASPSLPVALCPPRCLVPPPPHRLKRRGGRPISLAHNPARPPTHATPPASSPHSTPPHHHAHHPLPPGPAA